LALWGAYVTTVNLTFVDLLSAFTFAGLVFGAMLPYAFSGMTMKSVGGAAKAMVVEVNQQFNDNPRLVEYLLKVDLIEKLHDMSPQELQEYESKLDDEKKDGGDKRDDQKTLAELLEDMEVMEDTPDGEVGGVPTPDYQKCVAISTNASLREMIYPGLLVLLTPLIIGYLFGVKCLAGMLSGILSSGVQMAISMSNTGGAWDNAKKYIESGQLRTKHADGTETVHKKGSEQHKHAVVGDTVGDPLKDTSGPSLNILVKLSAITSLVFANTFPTTGYLVQAFE